MTTLLNEKASAASVYTKLQCDNVVTTKINALIDNAPDNLNTLNELATALNTKALLNSPSFTGQVQGISKSMVGLPNVDNTSDASQPISNLTQTALDNKQDKYQTYTGPITYDTTSKELKVDSYSKSAVDQKFADLVGVGTLQTLDT
jgi:hypothetical protein